MTFFGFVSRNVASDVGKHCHFLFKLFNISALYYCCTTNVAGQNLVLPQLVFRMPHPCVASRYTSVSTSKTATRWLTTQETCELLQVSRDTFAKWRGKRVGPLARRLPNGTLRFREDEVLDWVDGLVA